MLITAPVTIQELQRAEEAILTCLQAQVYGKETSVITNTIGTERKKQRQRKTEIKKSSSIYKLSPVLSQGILRVGGRLSNADMSECKQVMPVTTTSESTYLSDLICIESLFLGKSFEAILVS